MNKLFPIYEVGSLPKPSARVKALAAKQDDPVTTADVKDLVWYGKVTGVGISNIVDIVERQMRDEGKLSPEEREAIVNANALMNIRAIELSGFDFVYDGEARRSEMYRHIASQVIGFRDIPEMLRSRGPDSWRASVCIGEPRLSGPLEELQIVKEFEFVKSHASHPIKIPIDDPYMVANMTDNIFYTEKLRASYEKDPKKLEYEAKRALTLALAENIIRPQVKAAAKAGAKWIQLDVPSATIDVTHIPIMVEGINAVVDDLPDVKFSLHICYPRRVSLTDKRGYELLFPHVLSLHQSVDHFSLEFANGDQYAKDLAPFASYQSERKFGIGLGVVDITQERQDNNLIETPEIVRGRILEASRILKDTSLIYVAPDCGLRQVKLERAIRLYEIMSRGAELARRG